MTNELKQLQKKSVKSLSEKLHQLPMLPMVVSRLMVLNPDSDDYQQKVIQLLEEDPTFAVRILQLANSAYSHPTVPILTLKDAVVRMGSASISNLVTSLGVVKVFYPRTEGQRNLWVHAIQVGIASRVISTNILQPLITPDEAYLCGMLHDIGRFVMFSESPEELGRVDESNWKNPKELIEVERKLCGFDHAELGWHACKSWKIPALVTNVVRYHHEYHFKKTSSKTLKKMQQIIMLIQMADFFSVIMMTTPDFVSLSSVEMREIINQRCLVPGWEELPISVDRLEELSRGIYKDSENLIKKLGIFG